MSSTYDFPGSSGDEPREVQTAPVVKSFVGSTRDDRCLEVWFVDKVTTETRAWLLAAINEKALASAEAVHDLPFHKETMAGLDSLTIRAPAPAQEAKESPATEKFHFWMGARRFTTDRARLTGAEIKEIANESAWNTVYRDTGPHFSSHVAIGDGEAVDVVGARFYGLIPATMYRGAGS